MKRDNWGNHSVLAVKLPVIDILARRLLAIKNAGVTRANSGRLGCLLPGYDPPKAVVLDFPSGLLRATTVSGRLVGWQILALPLFYAASIREEK